MSTIPHQIDLRAKERPYSPAYYVKQNGRWQATNWRHYAKEVRNAGKALMNLGLPHGGKVSILGFNKPEWVIFDLGAMAVGGAAAGVYTTCSAEEVQYIVHHAEALVMLCENKSQWEKVKSQRDNLPLLKYVVMMKGAEEIDDPMVLTWEEFNAKAEAISDEDYDARLDALKQDELAALIYTSGTTGPPKGVMLSHKNLQWTSNTMKDMVDLRAGDCGVSYLPLSHIAEQMMTIHGPSQVGSAIYYAESIEKVPDNLKEVQPTVVFGVPRIWEKFYAGVTAKLKLATFPKNMLVEWVQGVCKEVNDLKNQGRSLPLPLELQYKLADKLVLSKLKPALGLGRARMCVTGAAPISKEILEFFSGLDVVIREVYGQSEDCGPTSFNTIGKTKLGSVGVAIAGCDVRIADDGEILVKGPNVFMGYFKEEAATNEALVDGWLHSGDLGEIDSAGFLSITGRKKDIIITAGGKNIAPKNIEAALKNHELIDEAVVIGDRRKYLSALVTIDPDAFAAFKQKNSVDGPDDPKIQAIVQRTVEEVNSKLARVETIKKFTILKRNFSVEDGELTPTLKVKRKIVNDHFADEIEAMYQ